MVDGLDPDVQDVFKDEGNGDESMVMDLTDVSEEGPEREPLPAGVYPCIFENTEHGKSNNSGNPMISWTLRVTDPEYEGRFLFYHTVLNKQSGISRLKRLLVRAVPEVDLGSFDPKRFCEEGRALGLPCRAKVRVKPYQGRRTNDVQEILAPNDDDNFLDD